MAVSAPAACRAVRTSASSSAKPARPKRVPAELDRPKAPLAHLADALGQRLDKVKQHGAIDRHGAAMGPAQEHVHGLAQRLSHQVPEGEIDGADGMGHGPAAAQPKGDPVQLLGDPLNLERIFAHHESLQPAERSDNLSFLEKGGDLADRALVGL